MHWSACSCAVQAFAVLADPTRRRILERLRVDEHSVGAPGRLARRRAADGVQASEGAAGCGLRHQPGRRAAAHLRAAHRRRSRSSTTGSSPTAAAGPTTSTRWSVTSTARRTDDHHPVRSRTGGRRRGRRGGRPVDADPPAPAPAPAPRRLVGADRPRAARCLGPLHRGPRPGPHGRGGADHGGRLDDCRPPGARRAGRPPGPPRVLVGRRPAPLGAGGGRRGHAAHPSSHRRRPGVADAVPRPAGTCAWRWPSVCSTAIRSAPSSARRPATTAGTSSHDAYAAQLGALDDGWPEEVVEGR